MLNVSITTRGGYTFVQIESDQTGLITGSAGGTTWTVGEYPGYPLVDPAAPRGHTVTYTQGQQVSLRVFVPPFGAKDVLADAGLRQLVPVFRANARERSRDHDVDVLWPADSPVPYTRRSGVARQRVEPFVFSTEPPHSQTVEAMLDEGLVWILHDTSRCAVKGCRIPTARLLDITSEAESYQGFSSEGEFTQWTLEGVPGRSYRPVAATTWADVARLGTWADVAEQGTWADVAKLGSNN